MVGWLVEHLHGWTLNLNQLLAHCTCCLMQCVINEKIFSARGNYSSSLEVVQSLEKWLLILQGQGQKELREGSYCLQAVFQALVVECEQEPQKLFGKSGWHSMAFDKYNQAIRKFSTDNRLERDSHPAFRTSRKFKFFHPSLWRSDDFGVIPFLCPQRMHELATTSIFNFKTKFILFSIHFLLLQVVGMIFIFKIYMGKQTSTVTSHTPITQFQQLSGFCQICFTFAFVFFID